MVQPSPSPRPPPRGPPASAEQVDARRILLDALDALGSIRSAVVLGGGQALDLRLPADLLPIALSTRDGDLTIDVRALAGRASLGERLLEAGLRPSGRHGHWERPTNRILRYFTRAEPVRVDVMVSDEAWPEAVAGPDPRLDGVASTMRPMVVTLIDDAPLFVPALDPSDTRRPTARVAGLASLLMTKVHKFETRRLRAVARRRALETIPMKDPLDVVRLLLAPGEELEAGVRKIRLDPRGAVVARESLSYLEAHFAREDGLGARLASQALLPHGASDRVAAACLRAAGIVRASGSQSGSR